MLSFRHAVFLTGFLASAASLRAQPPTPRDRNSPTEAAFVSRMMAFDDNHDGSLTRSEITDDRLLELFHRADANRDGIVTIDELKALYAKESAASAGRNLGGPGRGPEERQQPGQILPSPLRRMLALTPEQNAALDLLQHDVDLKLNALLTSEQKAQLKEAAQRGPGGPGFGPGGGGMPRRPGQL